MGKRLPLILQEIADVIGHDAMTTLARARGGTRAYIPANVTTDHWLAQTVGIELAIKLAKHFAQSHLAHGSKGAERMSWRGTFIVLPLAPRNEHVETGGNLSANTAALELGVTARTIHRRRSLLRQKAIS